MTYHKAAISANYTWEVFQQLDQEQQSWHIARFLTESQIQAVLQFLDFKKSKSSSSSDNASTSEENIWEDDDA